MEIDLILAAKSWTLAAQIEKSAPVGGVMVIKNVPERTYLTVTPRQWLVLMQFKDPRTVPEVLEKILQDRLSPALGEFYELILKAVRARILVERNHTAAPFAAVNWPVSVKPARVRYVLWLLFVTGLAITVWLRPVRPESVLDVVGGLVALAVGWAAGTALAASLIRGANAEVYAVGRWRPRLSDACLLSPADERLVLLAGPAMLATATAVLTWHQPGGSIFPMIGLLVMLRPVLRGRASRMIRVGAAVRLSDAEHAFLFPPNRTPRVRWRLLRAGLRSPTTWLEIGYGILWTLALGYFVGVMTEMPPWTVLFWKTQGPRLGLTLVGSLLLLALGYACSEFYLFVRDWTREKLRGLRGWFRRWLGRGGQPTDENARLRAVLRSPLLRILPPTVQQALAQTLQAHRVGFWKILHDFNAPVDQVSLIVSGKVGVYRKHNTGRRTLVQVLQEDDLVGLHAVADPGHPSFLYRTLTPVLLLRLNWEQAEEIIVARLGAVAIANEAQKLPFLARTRLCQNWHLQAVQRFAALSKLVDFVEDEVIMQRGAYSEHFFVMFEGEAKVAEKGRPDGILRGRDFFGEIGLLQNSNATAQVTAGPGVRCLSIMRREFVRFVASNYSVALELERVSSQRLGRPVLPLVTGNGRAI